MQVRGFDKTMTEQRAATTYMYEAADQLVEMTALRKLTLTGIDRDWSLEISTASQKASEQAAFYTVVKGVVWTKVFFTTTGDFNDRPDWHVSATLGDLTLYVRANGVDEQTLRAFLQAVDYDGLNGLLEVPEPNIGGDAPELAPEDEEAYAQIVLDRQRAATAAREEAAKAGSRREASTLMKIVDASPQGMVINRREAKMFEEMGFPDRSKQGDMRVMGLDEIHGHVAEMTYEQVYSFGMYTVQFAMRNEIDVFDTQLKFEGLWPGAKEAAARYAAGQMAASEPGYAVRKAEADGGLPLGSCLQLQSDHVICGIVAERFRFSFANQRINKKITWQEQRAELLAPVKEAAAPVPATKPTRRAAIAPARAEDTGGTRSVADAASPGAAVETPRSREEIKVNRFANTGRSLRSKSACGGTNFCRVSSD